MYCFSGDTADLVVKYDVGRDAIYSVKWYKVRIQNTISDLNLSHKKIKSFIIPNRPFEILLTFYYLSNRQYRLSCM